MSNKEVLTKAIEKAIANGWKGLRGIIYSGASFTPDFQAEMYMIANRPEEIIFNHDFAKSLWGEELVERYSGLTEEEYGPSRHEYALILIPRWQYHLKEMIVDDEPIKYLKRELMSNEYSSDDKKIIRNELIRLMSKRINYSQEQDISCGLEAVPVVDILNRLKELSLYK